MLSGPGRVSREAAEQRAAQEYEAFSTRRREARETAGEEALLRELEDAARRHAALKR